LEGKRMDGRKEGKMEGRGKRELEEEGADDLSIVK